MNDEIVKREEPEKESRVHPIFDDILQRHCRLITVETANENEAKEKTK
jgi:hypothetical protein